MKKCRFWNRLYFDGSMFADPNADIINSISFLKKQGVHKILDLGCATGRHSILLARHGFEVYGIDLSEKAIEIAYRKDDANLVNWKQGIASEIPFENECFDCVLAKDVLQFLDDDLELATQEISRVLTPAGILLGTVSADSHPYAKGNLKEFKGNTSHLLYCMRNDLPVRFFSKLDIYNLFPEFEIIEIKLNSYNEKNGKVNTITHEWLFNMHKNGHRTHKNLSAR